MASVTHNHPLSYSSVPLRSKRRRRCGRERAYGIVVWIFVPSTVLNRFYIYI
ncbi:hypothetical protein BDN72DRAFT_648340 [Pluteus cervinus]|uniref:Uncharacterized protein n=1 Tax=Pluteus cervinus TaxID=181527 RepID=A0ACD3ATE6_9AGAR|nr:hypothetical protein BDN72DRAFT_648340 [Pluteus cervinus]